ncbi:MAG: hypothetical protein ACXV4D_05065 [Ilumatobacteraceae bacterium]
MLADVNETPSLLTAVGVCHHDLVALGQLASQHVHGNLRPMPGVVGSGHKGNQHRIVHFGPSR